MTCYDVVGDMRHLLVVESVRGVCRLVVVCPTTAGEKEVGGAVFTEDAVVAHVTDTSVESRHDFQAFGLGVLLHDIKQTGVAFGAGDKKKIFEKWNADVTVSHEGYAEVMADKIHNQGGMHTFRFHLVMVKNDLIPWLLCGSRVALRSQTGRR